MARSDHEHDEGLVLTPDQRRRRRARNIAIGAVLAVVVLLIYVMALIRLTP
jgi:hypothetical protein